MLNEIVKIRDILTSYMLIYNRCGIFDKKYPEEVIIKKRNIYNIKWNTIRNSIYAVDIENSAVDITKLRLWLSIVVDQVEVDKRGPEPLPNLDCKIMQGNSLIDEYNGIKLIDEKFIEELKDRDNVKFNDGGTIKEKGKKIYISENQIQFGDGQKKVQIDDLIRLKKELYETTESARKKELLKRIQSTRKEILKLNFIGTNKEELLKIDNSHNKPYFAWMLEFIEVYIKNDGFDIVIGNPPYLGIQGIIKTSPELEKIYKVNYESATGYYDLYTLFVENGLKRLIAKKGILNYIMPHSWTVSEFGKGLRGLIKEKYHFKQFISFGAYKVFNASTYTSLIWIENKEDNDVCMYYEVDRELKDNNELAKELKSIVQKNLEKIDMKSFSSNSWIFANKRSLEIMKKIQSNGIIAKDVFKGIYKGITSGDNKAVCLKNGIEEGDYIVAYSLAIEKSVKLEKGLTKKMFVGDSLKKYEANYDDDYIIYPYKKEGNNTVLIPEEELKEQYPMIYEYLTSIKERLSSRGTEKMKYPSWYSLWNFRKIENFESEKIITPDVCHNTSMYLDIDNYYYNDMCYALIKKDEIKHSYKYLIGILNSKLFWFFLNNTGTVLSGGFFRFKTKYIENFKIILTENEEKIKEIEDLVELYIKNKDKKIESELDMKIYELYNLTDDEIKYIEEKF